MSRMKWDRSQQRVRAAKEATSRPRSRPGASSFILKPFPKTRSPFAGRKRKVTVTLPTLSSVGTD